MTPDVEPVHVPGYVDRPYEQVCAVLEAWKGRTLSDGSSSTFVVGEVSRVSRWSAHVPIERVDPGAPPCTAELRILPIHTGRDALTELLLVMSETSSQTRACRVERTRRLLDAVVHELDAAAPPVSDRAAS